MKKIFLVFTAALLISGTAFAGKSSFEVGVTYGNISTINKNNSQLLTQINSALEELHKNGTYAEIYNKWFGADDAAAK